MDKLSLVELLSQITTASALKLIENYYRTVQIATNLASYAEDILHTQKSFPIIIFNPNSQKKSAKKVQIVKNEKGLSLERPVIIVWELLGSNQ